jgi:hypothetical protein
MADMPIVLYLKEKVMLITNVQLFLKFHVIKSC